MPLVREYVQSKLQDFANDTMRHDQRRPKSSELLASRNWIDFRYGICIWLPHLQS